MLFSSISQVTANQIIFVFEILAMIIGAGMLVTGILQNKESQTGLAALNGGNDELFANSKERGKEKNLSIVMLSLGIALVTDVIICSVLTNTLLVSVT